MSTGAVRATIPTSKFSMSPEPGPEDGSGPLTAGRRRPQAGQPGRAFAATRRPFPSCARHRRAWGFWQKPQSGSSFVTQESSPRGPSTLHSLGVIAVRPLDNASARPKRHQADLPYETATNHRWPSSGGQPGIRRRSLGVDPPPGIEVSRDQVIHCNQRVEVFRAQLGLETSKRFLM